MVCSWNFARPPGVDGLPGVCRISGLGGIAALWSEIAVAASGSRAARTGHTDALGKVLEPARAPGASSAPEAPQSGEVKRRRAQVSGAGRYGLSVADSRCEIGDFG
jgi:hypothetical protein